MIHDLPCPCGSGKTMMKCCLSGPFPSPDAAEDRVDQMVNGFNRRGLDDFCGLSPLQMDDLLKKPWKSPDLIALHTPLPEDIAATPVMRDFLALTSALGEKGVKATATGNLPLKLTRTLMEQMLGSQVSRDPHEWGRIRSETDASIVHQMRTVAHHAGMVRRTNNRWHVTLKAQKLLDGEKFGTIYRQLFEVFTGKYNWFYLSPFQQLNLIQYAGFFSLFLLARFGSHPRPARFYVEKLCKAFPIALSEIDSTGIDDPMDYLTETYHDVVCRGYFRYFGLAVVQDGTPQTATLKKTPLLDKLIRFKLK